MLPGRLLEAARTEQLDDNAQRAKHGESYRVESSIVQRLGMWSAEGPRRRHENKLIEGSRACGS